MAIPRYEGGSTPFQQVDPTAAKASAQMFSSLSQRLDSWGDTLYERGKVVVAEEGRKQAVNDIVSGDPLKVEKGYGFYSKAYNDVTTAAFNVQIESDLKSKAEEYASASANEPDKFKAMFGAYAKTTISKLQEPEFQAIAMQTAQKTMGTYSANLTKEAFKNRRENDLKVIDANITDLSNEYYSAFAKDDYETTAETLTKITSLMDSKVKAGALGEGAVPLEIKRIYSNGIKQKAVSDIELSLENGELGATQRFKKSDFYKGLPLEERKTMDESISNSIERAYKSKTQQYDLENKYIEQVSTYKKEQYLGDMFLNKPVDEVMLKSDLDNGTLSSTHYKEIQAYKSGLEVGGLVDDYETLLRYETQMGSINIQELLSTKAIKAETKRDIIARDRNFRQKSREIDALSARIKDEKTLIGSHPRTAGISILNKFPMYPKNSKKDSLEKISIIREVDGIVANDPMLAPQYMDLITQKIDTWKARNQKVVESNDYDAKKDQYKMEKQKYDDSYNSNISKLKRWTNQKAGATPEPYAPPQAPKAPDGYLKPKDR